MKMSLVFSYKSMEMINGKKYYDIDEASELLDEVILKQSEVLRKNLQEKRNISFVKK